MDDLRRDAELLLARPDAGRPPTIRRVAAAWLAEHPADEGELVTEEWLDTIGRRRGRSLDFSFGPPGRTVTLECRGTALPPEERVWYFGNHPMPTRGKVRALLAVLG